MTPACFEPDARLLRGQDPALGVREVPRRRSAARHPHEVGGRGHGDRPHLPRGAAQGLRALESGDDVLPGAGGTRRSSRRCKTRCASRTPSACATCSARWPAATAGVAVARSPASIRWFLHQMRAHRRARPVDASSARARSGARWRDGLIARRQAHGHLGPASGRALRDHARPTCAQRRSALGILPVMKAVDTCGAEFEAETPYFYSTYEEESEVPAERPAAGDDPRQRSQPHRAGPRVRLLLRAGGARAQVARLRGAARQLQSRDGEHRLRHLEPALLRAAHRSRTCSTSSTPSVRPA